MRAQGISTSVTKIEVGAVLVSQGAVVKEDGSHKKVVTAVRRSASNTWLTIDGAEIRYSNRESVLVAKGEDNWATTVMGKQTNTSTNVRYRVSNTYGHRR